MAHKVVSICIRLVPASRFTMQVLIDRTPHANEKQQADIFRDVIEVRVRGEPLLFVVDS